MGRNKKILCIETGVIYNSINKAASSIKLKSSSSIRDALDKSNRKAGGYHWSYYDEPDLVGEIWKDAKCITDEILYDFTNRFLVSNRGRVKDLETNTITNGYKGIRGYMIIRIDGKYHRVHRMVATTFIPNPENKPTVDHIDTDTSNNSVENLRWATSKEQVNDNEITKEKIIKNAHRKKVKCVETGKIFNSVKDAAEYILLKNPGSISNALNKENKTSGGYHWVSIDEE